MTVNIYRPLEKIFYSKVSYFTTSIMFNSCIFVYFSDNGMRVGGEYQAVVPAYYPSKLLHANRLLA